MMVKVCGITNLEDALAAAQEGVSALGFVFYPRSPRYITPEAAARIVERVPAGIWRVGVFVNETPEAVRSVARSCGLDVAQLHGDETPGDVPGGVRAWKAFRASGRLDSEVFRGFEVEAFVLDAAAAGDYGGAGRTFSWHLAYGLKQKIVLAGGLDASNVREAIRQARPWGVDASSRLESSPGKKDHEKMRAFIRAARTETES